MEAKDPELGASASSSHLNAVTLGWGYNLGQGRALWLRAISREGPSYTPHQWTTLLVIRRMSTSVLKRNLGNTFLPGTRESCGF